MDFNKLFTDILKLDSTIHYAAIQKNTGENIVEGFSENTNPIINGDELKMINYYASQSWKTHKNIEHKIGNTKYAMAEYDKIKRIVIPVNEKHLLMLATEINTDHTNIINKILKLIRNNSK